MIGAEARSPSEFQLLPAPTIPKASHASLRCGAREQYDVEPAGDRLLIVHNDGAEDFELA